MDGRRVESFEDLMNYVAFHGREPIEFKIERMGRVFTTVITPKVIEQDDGFGNRTQSTMIGVGVPVDLNHPARLDPTYIKHIRYSFVTAIGEAFNRTVFITTQTVLL